MQPPQEWIDRYPTQWDAENGPYRGDNGYLPHPRPRAAYAAMISDLDEHVGTILKRLDRHQLSDNTIVVFTSDNGPTHGGRNPNFHIGGAACTFFHSNAGLKGFKGSVDEGGIRIPCIVRWPGKVAANTTSDFPSYFPDWFPTLTEIAGGTLPDQTLDGVNLLPVLKSTLTSTATKRERPLVWNFAGYGGQAAIRDGKWKAVRRNLSRKNPGPWELYDLEADRNETTDLASQHPEIAKRLADKFLSERSYEPDFPMAAYDKPNAK